MLKVALCSDGSEVQLRREELIWREVYDLGMTESHLSEELFQKCQILLWSEAEFSGHQAVLEKIHDCLKRKGHTKGFQDNFRWQDTDYREAYLIEKGFKSLSTSTLVAVPDGSGMYDVKFFYLIERVHPRDPMAAFCGASFVGGDVRYKNLAGQSIVKERGDKTMAGKMLAYGSWNAYGSAAQDLGKGVKQVRAYGPNGKANAKVHSLMRDHVDDLTSREESLTPACAASRMLNHKTRCEKVWMPFLIPSS